MVQIRKIIFVLALLLSINQAAIAGWYQVTNYTGTIGSYPIHLSLQKYDFGGGIALVGSYYYDRHLSPIPVYGKYNGSGQMELCETRTSQLTKIFKKAFASGVDTTECEFKLKFQDNAASGTWSRQGKQLAVTLKLVASLDDGGNDQSTNEGVEIPFWGQTSQYMFLGTYKANQRGTSSIQVIDKRTGRVAQKLDSELSDCGPGTDRTIIYENIEKSVKANEQIVIWCAGKFSSPLFYSFKSTTGKFEPDHVE